MTVTIGRRGLLAALGGAAAWPLAAQAQQAGKLPTIGFFSASSALAIRDWVAALVQRLGELGWIEGRTVAIEYRWAEGHNERLAQIAAEFVQLKVDVIVTHSTAPVIAAKQATSTIPIVFASVAADPPFPRMQRRTRPFASGTASAPRPRLRSSGNLAHC